MDGKYSHIVQLIDRKNLMVSDVKDIDSFNTNEVILETGQGVILVKGKDIHVKRLNLEKGEADVEGNFDSIAYTGAKKIKKESLAKRLFS